MKKIPVIIDADPGVDDTAAIALSLYDDYMDIQLITTVSGNLDIDSVTRNTLHVLELFKRTDIPVARGAVKPMCREPKDAKFIHQASGMGNYEPPDKVDTQPIKKDAVEAMYSALKKHKTNKMDIIILGPHTNVGQLIEKHPDAKDMIRHIYCEGCAPYGWEGQGERWKHYVSFNASSDPEAFDIVARSGIPLTIVPSRIGRDVTNFTEEEVINIGRINDVGNFIYQMYSGFYEHGYVDKRIATNDTCAVLAMRFPDIFTTIPVTLEVDTKDMPGRTIMTPVEKSHIELVINADREKLKQYFFTGIKRLDWLKIKI